PPSQRLLTRRPHLAPRYHMDQLAVVAIDATKAPAAQAHRALHDGLEDRLDVGRRAGDDAEDLARCRLLLERPRELSRALLDLVLQVGVGLAELCRHRVELLGQAFDLVARL